MTLMTPPRNARRKLAGEVDCDQCKTTAYRVAGDSLIIEHRHDGSRHTTVVNVESLLGRIPLPLIEAMLDNVRKARGE